MAQAYPPHDSMRRLFWRRVAVRVHENNVMISRELPRFDAPFPITPCNLVAERTAPENRVHHELEVMAHGRVAVQVDAAH